MYAQIIDGRVAALTEAPVPLSPIVEVGPEVQVGWLWTPQGCVAPPESAAPDISPLRHAAYIAESDPLFFKWQRGEVEKDEWLAAVEDIKVRYPDPAP